MKIEYYEKVFLVLSVVILVLGLGAVGATVFAAGVHVPSPAGRVDPKTVRQTPPFDQPQVRSTGTNQYEADMLAQIWSFNPGEIRVPAGSTVTFRITSADVVHGFEIEKTTINAMLIPGQITEVKHTFDKPGEYLMICHEYCGSGHHTMYGRVVVE
jgi:cytochrome c oxidase subunit 2